MNPSKKRNNVITYIGLVLIYLIFAYCGYFVSIGCEKEGNIVTWLNRMDSLVFNNMPKSLFSNHINEYTIMWVGIATICYGIYLLFKLVDGKKKYMHGKEYGTSELADVHDVCAKLCDTGKDSKGIPRSDDYFFYVTKKVGIKYWLKKQKGIYHDGKPKK